MTILTGPAPQSGKSTAPASWALASLSLAMLLPSLGVSSSNIALPTIAQVFDASFQQVQWIVLSYLLAITALIVSAGRLGDLIGRRRLLLAGIGLFTMASLLCGLAPTLPVLVGVRAVQGIGAAVMMALTMAFVGDVMPKNRIGRAMGLLGAMSAIGTALGPAMGGVLIAEIGWRSLFLVNVPVGALALLLAFRFLPADRLHAEPSTAMFDLVGTVLLALSLLSLSLAVTLGRGQFGTTNLALLLGAVVGLAAFLFSQGKLRSPLIKVAMLSEPSVSGSLAMSLLVATVMMATLVVGPFYMSRALGLDATTTGFLLSIGPIAAALGGIPAGRLADHFGAHSVTVSGLTLIAAGALVLSRMPIESGIPGYVLPMAAMTIGFAFFQAGNNTSIMSDIAAKERGVLSGMLILSRNLGFIAGASVMGGVFAAAAGTSNVMAAAPEAVAVGMRVTFGVAAAIIIAALMIAWRTRIKAVGDM